MKIKIKKTSIRGFSLIEALITIFIVGLVLLLFQTTLGGFRFIRALKNQEIALHVANNKIEELRSGGYANLPESGSFSDSQIDNLLDHSASMTITDFNASTKQVEVVIQWREMSGSVLKNVSLATLITEVGGL